MTRAGDEVRAWLSEHWDPDLSVDEWWQIVGRRRLDRAAPPSGAGRARPAPHRVEHRARRLRRVRRAAPARRPRPADGRADDPHARHARSDRPPRAADPRGRGELVPAVQRAGRGLGSRRAHDARRARRRPLDHQRPEGVEQHGPRVRLRDAARPHRLLGAEARGHLVVRVQPRPARRHGPAAARDDRRVGVQRGLPRRRGVRRRRPHRRCRERVGGHPDDAVLRAIGHRRRRRPRGVPGARARRAGCAAGAPATPQPIRCRAATWS